MRKKCLAMFFLKLLIATALVHGEESVPAPTFKDGDYWKFEYKMSGGASISKNLPGGTYTVSFQDGKLLLEGKEVERVGTLDVFGLAVPRLGTSSWYNFPLQVGKTWNLEQKLGGSGRSFIRYTDFIVDKSDKIVTAAGAFEVLKLTRVTRQTFVNTTSQSETVYYYSPATKSAVKANYSGTSGEVGEITLLEYGNKP